MKSNININEKLRYSSPEIKRVELDNEISLTLDSNNPSPGPGEPGYVGSLAPEYFNADPFKANIG